MLTSNGTCSTAGCENPSRWPRRNRGMGYCDSCLTHLVEACDATVMRLGDGPRERFRTRHNPCGAVVDVSLAMIRRGGWVCQMCKRSGNLAQMRQWPWYGDHADVWPVARQEQMLAAAGLRPLQPLGDADKNTPINVECLE